MSEKTAKSSGRVTIDHGEIRQWAEERGGRPAMAKEAGEEKGAGILEINFGTGDGQERNIEEVSWEEFFDEFEKKRLAFLYEENAGGEDGRFYRFVNRDQ